MDSFISGTQDVNKTPLCASSKALVPRFPTKWVAPLFTTAQSKILWDEIEQGQIILFLQLLSSNKNNPQTIYFSCASKKQQKY